MKHFGIHKKHKLRWQDYLRMIHIPFLVLVSCCLAVFSLYAQVSNIIFSSDKLDVIQEDLQDVAFYFWTIDQDLSKFFLTLDDIIQAYIHGENIFKSKEYEIEYSRNYIKNNKDYLTAVGFDHYEELLSFLADVWKYKDEIFKLLGSDEAYNYLVVLQNSNEKRPNGGFFGSFAFIRVDAGRIQELEVIDAYYPNFVAPKSFVYAPAWANGFLDDRQIGFIAANKFGFTDMDGKNIKLLYEQIFGRDYDINKVQSMFGPDVSAHLLNQNIKGVIFLESAMFEKLLPGFREKIWEWQFINAAVDLIRGEEKSNKKELYIQEITQYFQNNQWEIARHLVNNFSGIIQDQTIDIYLSNVSPELNGLLQKYQLSTVYNPDYIYAWDTNNSFNKVDGFVDKHVQISHIEDGLVVADTDKDIIWIGDLPAGDYRMSISYTMNIPQLYVDFIDRLENTYNIALTDRELGILALQPNQYQANTPYRRWQSRSILYFPPGAEIITVSGQLEEYEQFITPFAQGMYYFMKILENNTSKTMSLTFRLP